MTESLLILAADQRPWLTRDLFGHTGRVTPRERAFTAEAKHFIYEALATVGRPDSGMLVDAELGPGVAERVRDAGLTLIIPIEKAGLKIYQTEPDDLAAHLAYVAPDWAKVLVRYNPGDPADERAEQRKRLAEASRVTRDSGARFLFELLVPAVGEDQGLAPEEYLREVRPELTRRAMEEIAGDVAVDTWKLEPQGSVEAFRLATETATEHGATCVLLGAGAPLETVTTWIADARQGGFIGFAVGRTIWQDPVRALYADRATRSTGLRTIARRYQACVEAFDV